MKFKWEPLITASLLHNNHCLFTQMDVLCHFRDDTFAWKEAARWLKYEEKVEIGGRWSKPHVTTTSLHAILQLREAITSGRCMLDMQLNVPCPNLTGLNLFKTDSIRKLRHILTQPHKHKNRKGERKRKINNNNNNNNNNNKNNNNINKENNDANDINNANKTTNKKLSLPNRKLMKKIPNKTETASILIGQVDFLNEPIIALFRLKSTNVVEELCEVALPTRFVALAIGPFKKMTIGECNEIGRAMAALFNDKVFCEVAYNAYTAHDILTGIDEYLDDLTVLPPSIWDPCARLEPPVNTKTKVLMMMEEVLNDDVIDESLIRTGRIKNPEYRLFGGLVADVKRRFRYFLSDIRDGLHVQCIASIIFLYFACITPIVTFGGLMGRKTDNYMGTMETLTSAAVCGCFYALFSGQPLTIIGATGPLLVFESILYHLCKENRIDFLSFRCWIGLWSFVYLLIIVAFDLSSYVRYITRFTEESFAVLISLIFIVEAFSKIFEIWHTHPVLLRREAIYTNTGTSLQLDPSENDVNLSRDDVDMSRDLLYGNDEGCLTKDDCQSANWTTLGAVCDNDNYVSAVPDVFLLSFLLFFGTFSIAFTLRTFRNSPFFPSLIRNLLGDFAVFLSIVAMTVVDYFFGLDTPKLEVPNEFKPTLPDRGWLVNPLKINHWWLILVATFPGLLATILISLDQQITAVIINRKEHKLKKGHGYHLDLFVLAILIAICSFLGLPWFVAATVRAITHVKSLIRESEVKIPGERPQMLGVREQRVTGFLIHLFIGFSTLLTSVLRLVPMPVLYGVFLYMGITSLGDVQFVERVLLLFMPIKHQPDCIYLRHVKTRNVHSFTLIQIGCSVLMWSIKSIQATSIGFPLVLIALIVTRKVMDLLFSQRDLYWLDNLLPDNKRRKSEDLKKHLDAIDLQVILIINQTNNFE
ncbi:hypothetical protein HELRODRAFT_78329 [Helobdella robusta]|uniref:Anion exchange protein n=1 Tax=Helobdella robusta TaxID=6412 RepID=T1G3A7_HELRO|nr:hypothetical protein HELRODRAFT_78329 [Helobdella robusta]ESO05115.1 hypothetical protein HELRODRAFT_78329 [Helobdella robusta]